MAMVSPSVRSVWIAAAGSVLAIAPALASAALWPASLAFWGALLCAIGVDAVLTPHREAFDVALETPEVLHVGAAEEGTLRVATSAARTLRLEARVDVGGELAALPAQRASAGGGTIARLPLMLRARRRGMVRLRTVHLRVTGPLGLVRRTLSFVEERAMPVIADVPRIRTMALRHFSSREFRTGLKIERYAGDGSEFEALRQHQPGMDNRAIDWNQSARHRELLSRKVRAERNHTVLLAVDAGRLMGEPIGELPKVDHAIAAALLLSYFCLRSGDRVGVWGFDDAVRARHDPVAGVQALPRLVRALSDLDYSERETNFTVALTDLLARQRRRALVVVLTDFVDTTSAETMLDNVARVARRHVVLFVALRDPTLDAAWQEAPRSSEALHRAVIAERLLRDREGVLRRLRRLGVHCIDAPPEAVSTSLLDRYLEIKRRELV